MAAILWASPDPQICYQKILKSSSISCCLPCSLMKVTQNSLFMSTTSQFIHGKLLESLLLGYLAHAHAVAGHVGLPCLGFSKNRCLLHTLKESIFFLLIVIVIIFT